MKLALKEAEMAAVHGDVPVGAVVVLDGRIIGRGHNMREALADPTAHAEVMALRDAAAKLGTWYLVGATLYVTLEPCIMCVGAAVLSRIDRIVFGAYDEKMGALVSNLKFSELDWLNHKFEYRGGVMAEESRRLLRDFFRRLRGR
jgi:tRNA(adenine34) deaminase